MVSAVSDALDSMISWIGTFITSLTSSSGALYALLPLFAIGIAASLCMFAMKMIRKVTWGS